MFKPSRYSHKPTPSSSVPATNNINLIMSHTPLLSDCGSMGLTLNKTLDGVSTHDGVTALEEDEAYVRPKAETRSDVLLFANLYSAMFILLRHLVTLSSLVTIALMVLMTLYWSKYIMVSCFRIDCYLLHNRSRIDSFTDNTILPMSVRIISAPGVVG